jgi:Fe-S cluster assembly scaffold protein SufB
VGEEQLFYLMSRGLSEEEATTMVVSGFIEPLVKELPMEYAIEMNRLIQLQMEGSIGNRIHLWAPGSNLAHFSHVLVLVDDGADLTYVHEVASDSLPQAQSMHAGIVELHVGQNAHLRFVELQSWGSHVWHFSPRAGPG